MEYEEIDIKNLNLNKITVSTRWDEIEQNNFSIIGENKDIEVYFKDIEKIIIQKIRMYDSVIGCVAWLTNENILKELAKKERCLIIVQDEDFLRPDISFDGNKLTWKNKIMKLYKNLNKGGLFYFGDLGISHNCHIDSGIRRCGLLNKNKSPAFPRMHNKFIVCYNTDNEFFNECGQYDIEKDKNDVDKTINRLTYDMDDIYSVIEHNKKFRLIQNGEVITGSFNFTENSNNSFENIVCIKDKKIVDAYYQQFGEIFLMSMPLNWSCDWDPGYCEYRYGS